MQNSGGALLILKGRFIGLAGTKWGLPKPKEEWVFRVSVNSPLPSSRNSVGDW